MMTRRKDGYASAVQVTNAAFDGDHPNDAHVPGVRYSPQRRCAYVTTATGTATAGIGDWIVTRHDGALEVFSRGDFRAVYGDKE